MATTMTTSLSPVELNAFLNSFQLLKSSQRNGPGQGHGLRDICQQHTTYPKSIFIDDMESDGDPHTYHLPPPSVSSGPSNGSAPSHPPSTVFDSDCSRSILSSHSSAPSRVGVAPQHHRRPAMPSASFDTTIDGPFLPCEFVGYADCNRQFRLHQVADWSTHICQSHLRGILPEHTICWFCHQFEFASASSSYEDCELAFLDRMRHIASHFHHGASIDSMRPDFFFLDHIYDHGLISTETYKRAKDFREFSPGIELNTVPVTRRVAMDVRVVTERRRPRGERGNRRSGGYYSEAAHF